MLRARAYGVSCNDLYAEHFDPVQPAGEAENRSLSDALVETHCRDLAGAGLAALVFNTSNTARDREAAVFGDPLERLWKDCVFGLCGVSRFERRVFRT